MDLMQMIALAAGANNSTGAGGEGIFGIQPSGYNSLGQLLTPEARMQLQASAAGQAMAPQAPTPTPTAPIPVSQTDPAAPQTDTMAAMLGSVKNPGQEDKVPLPYTTPFAPGRNVSPEAVQMLLQAMMGGGGDQPQTLGQIFAGR